MDFRPARFRIGGTRRAAAAPSLWLRRCRVPGRAPRADAHGRGAPGTPRGCSSHARAGLQSPSPVLPPQIRVLGVQRGCGSTFGPLGARPRAPGRTLPRGCAWCQVRTSTRECVGTTGGTEMAAWGWSGAIPPPSPPSSRIPAAPAATSPQSLPGEFPAPGVGMNDANWLRRDMVGMREKTPGGDTALRQSPRSPGGCLGLRAVERGEIMGQK